MNWDQIESKWAAMTLRIRADWAADRVEPKRATARPVKTRDTAPAIIAEAWTEAANNTSEFKTATK